MNLSRLLEPSAYINKFKQFAGLGPQPIPPSYEGDGMCLRNKNMSALSDPKFISAYQHGMNSGHTIGRQSGSDQDTHVEFRAYIECWAASQSLNVAGDLVFCGVNTGIFPLAIAEFIDLNATGRNFWLFDTYEGIPERQAEEAERDGVRIMNAQHYTNVWDVAARNFSPYPNARLVKGIVPETLSTVDIDRVSYLSIDMNIAFPERAALEFFWPKLSPGGTVIFDDYAFAGHSLQQRTINEFARSVGLSVLTLPTGQGLMQKPPTVRAPSAAGGLPRSGR